MRIKERSLKGGRKRAWRRKVESKQGTKEDRVRGRPSGLFIFLSVCGLRLGGPGAASANMRETSATAGVRPQRIPSGAPSEAGARAPGGGARSSSSPSRVEGPVSVLA